MEFSFSVMVAFQTRHIQKDIEQKVDLLASIYLITPSAEDAKGLSRKKKYANSFFILK